MESIESPPSPAAGEVHVWAHFLGGEADRELLSADEQERADRFGTDSLRDRWVSGRVALRSILSRYVELSPTSLGFSYEGQGRPQLVKPKTDLVFNRSSSASRSVVAISRGCELGIDLESIDGQIDHSDLARRFFTKREAEWVAAAPAATSERFLRVWTAKEAVVKALGLGFGLEPDSFEVFAGPPPRLVTAPEGSDPSAWWLSAVDVAADFLCTLAIHGGEQPPRVKLIQLPTSK